VTDTRTQSPDRSETFSKKVRALCREYGGGSKHLSLAAEHPDAKARLRELLGKLANERRQALPHEQRPVWQQVQIGGSLSRAELLMDLRDMGIAVTEAAQRVIQRAVFADSPRLVSVYLVPVADLGITKPTMTPQVDAIVSSLGYCRLPVEVGPCLRRQYRDQPARERLCVWTEALDVRHYDFQDVFELHAGTDGLSLRTRSYHTIWYPDDELVLGRA